MGNLYDVAELKKKVFFLFLLDLSRVLGKNAILKLIRFMRLLDKRQIIHVVEEKKISTF